MCWVLILFAAMIVASPAARAFESEGPIHSDLPFWSDQTSETSKMRASPFMCGDGAWCSRLNFGDWKSPIRMCTDFADGDPPPPCKDFEVIGEDWMRLSMVSFMDGGLAVSHVARKRGDLAAQSFIYSVIGELGMAPDGEELFAMQKGFIGGSTYILLAARPAADGGIEEFRELFPVCEEHSKGVEYRQADFYTFYGTGYCAVKSPAQLRALALSALQRQSRTWTWIGPSPKEKSEEENPTGTSPTGSPR